MNGEIIAATPVAAYAVPRKFEATSSVPKYDHIGTYQTPHMKNWKNIKIQKRTVSELFIGNSDHASKQKARQSIKIISLIKKMNFELKRKTNGFVQIH
tara:strand:- start:1084 stop:1377 length:294 start_codon:yes stop_codon:yes gene_type:complete